jgi:hypothetical protein
MVGQPSHVKQLSLNHVCKIGLKFSRKGEKLNQRTLYPLDDQYLCKKVRGDGNICIIFVTIFTKMGNSKISPQQTFRSG